MAMEFIQKEPQITDPYESDEKLQKILQWLLNSDPKQENIEKDLKSFSKRLLIECEGLAKEAEDNPPQHIPYSPWGQRIDEIKVSKAWEKLDAISSEEGIIQIGYDSKNTNSGRIHQFAKIYLFHPSSAFYTCPLAMTDGAAKLIQVFMKRDIPESIKEKLIEAYSHITSRNPKDFWTSGQWMTEKTGGSDVAISETTATATGSIEAPYLLHGTKWFTSATTSQVCFTLARIKDEKGNVKEGSKGLSLFFMKLRDDHGNLQKMTVRRLKDKLGTKALPTAEIDLNGSPAYLIGNPGEGIKNISHLFNVTRIYNACTTVGAFRRLLQLAEDYSHKRIAFGKTLRELPLHQRFLEEVNEEFEKCLLLTFNTVRLLQKEETLESQGKESKENAALLRLMTPLTKLYTAKKNMIWTSELVESFGGAGFIEDTGIPRFLRDAQVLTIWEGTTNVLSLDCLRAIQKENAMEAYVKEIHDLSHKIESSEIKSEVLSRLSKLCAEQKSWGSDTHLWQRNARVMAFELCEILILALRPLVF